jgi:hypothetical protein
MEDKLLHLLQALNVYELGIVPQHKQRDWTNPQRISLIPLYEWLILHLIGTTAKK